ncbi:HhH-GPD family protein [Gemmatirosa kalamazoonensis]|uniref:DNA-3-methyladenine glycosylase II n=1 Tax=Gemmatirosa kalamazoonensis TaxID=861299 RepID=W0RD87_9BACT|nr:AlkA N-terminal domain-containing protein [Gemmatirosa kalamazoonensis]AHG89084.1 HhH-GPD family protein [Gemmatirosa kalamazoonensis]
MTATSRPLHLAAPDGFDFRWITGFLAPRAVPSIERVTDHAYVRVVRLPVHGPVRVTVRANGAALRAASDPALAPAVLRGIVTRMLDLGEDVTRFRAHVARDRALGPIVARHTAVRLPQLLDPFEGLVRGLLGQQVSVRAASTIADRLVRLLGEPLGGDEPSVAFPSADAVADASVDTLRSLGVPRTRAAALRACAAAVRDGRLRWDAVRAMPADEAQRALDDLPGVGPWTASYVRMRALGDRDAFPAADLGVVKALARLGVAPADAERAAERWRPWRAYATVFLWTSLSDPV